MKEARIECLVREWPVHDLGLALKQGQIVFVGLDDARNSSDLADAKRLGTVRVRYVERARMHRNPPRSPPPPNVRLPRKTLRPGPEPVSTPPPAQATVSASAPQAAPLDLAEFRQVAKDAAVEALREITGELRALVQAVAAAPRATGSTAGTAGTVQVPLASAEPMFIPDNIVDKGAAIQVASESTDGGDMDAAAAALRGQRPTKNRKKPEKE